MSISNIRNTTRRFYDVAGEPCVTLAPISGINKQPLVTLEKATEPLINIVPLISTYVHVVKVRAANPADDLSVDESAAIALYTMEWEPYTDSLYYILNTTLRTEDRQSLKPWFLYLKLIFTALSRLPSQNTKVYRGVRFENEDDYEKYQEGAELIWWGFSSCSISRNISEKDQFLGQTGKRILFVIDCLKGTGIEKHSYHQKEEEVLLLPATKVKVISYKYQGNGLYVINLQEIESSFILLEPVSSEREIEILKNTSMPTRKSFVPNIPVIQPDRYSNSRLSQLIIRYRHHSEVYLNGKRFTEDDIEIVVEQVIKEKECRELFLRESGVTCQGAVAISNALYINNTLERLFMSHNKVGDEGAKAIAYALSNNQNSTLKHLSLGFNGITDEGIGHLAEMLKSNTTLTHLYLPSNEINDCGLQQLADVLTNENKTLQLLSLEWNKFRSDACVNILVGILKNNKSLTTLNVNSCKLPKSANKELKDVAKTRKLFKLIIN